MSRCSSGEASARPAMQKGCEALAARWARFTGAIVAVAALAFVTPCWASSSASEFGLAPSSLQASDADWISLGAGFNGAVYAAVVAGDDVYVGGAFTSTPSGPANHIAKWDGTSWSALGSGVGNNVFALAWDGSNLYAGGLFTLADTTQVNHIAMWDGATWQALGSGTDNNVSALAWMDGKLYVGGRFDTAGGIGNLGGIAQWNGAWSAMGLGTNGTVNALGVVGSALYVGGTFTWAGTPAQHVAKFEAGNWSALGGGIGADVNALTGANGRVVAAVQNLVVQWDGAHWSQLGTAMDNFIFTLGWDGSRVYAGGQFTAITGVGAVNRVAMLQENNWVTMGSGADGWVDALAGDPVHQRIIVAGEFNNAGNKPGRVAVFKADVLFANGFE